MWGDVHEEDGHGAWISMVGSLKELRKVYLESGK